ncbi:hypothetical protein KDW_60510 [Dictyobacter vulcani]|uniref:3'-5' exonuclease n=1 Tax=Dictyobacter vulcani TaxID=2607529 RepID=A0A5J4L0S8_9CHLR|nr:hypothetical protein [Dictyobacter vulcani]GER91889.1 hypothetical protein KDW_60510 [Dictyobacter vulcani]
MTTQHVMPIRQSFPRWCRSLQERTDWVLLDTESFVLPSQRSEAIAIAVVDAQGQILFERMFQPCAVDPDSEREQDLDDLLIFAQLWSDLNDVLLGKTIISYGAAYNSQLLMRTAALRHVSMPGYTWHCAMVAYAEYKARAGQPRGTYCWPRLAHICQSQPQRGTLALADAMATLNLIRAGAL